MLSALKGASGFVRQGSLIAVWIVFRFLLEHRRETLQSAMCKVCGSKHCGKVCSISSWCRDSIQFRVHDPLFLAVVTINVFFQKSTCNNEDINGTTQFLIRHHSFAETHIYCWLKQSWLLGKSQNNLIREIYSLIFLRYIIRTHCKDISAILTSWVPFIWNCWVCVCDDSWMVWTSRF